jgi:glycosidase
MTLDMRISGTCASLAGLEKALREETEAISQGDPSQVELAIRRILLIHSVILSIGGIPLIYLGDEVGTLNDYDYREDPAKTGDSRWVHRPAADWDKIALRCDEGTVQGQVFTRLRRLIETRKNTPAFAGGETEIIDTGNAHVFGYVRQNTKSLKDRKSGRVLVLASFIEREQKIAANELRLHGLGYGFTDLVTGEQITSDEDLTLGPYCFVWLRAP